MEIEFKEELPEVESDEKVSTDYFGNMVGARELPTIFNITEEKYALV